jgi:dipeptidyl aminopeptidase/acylaminoacyl peptidase
MDDPGRNLEYAFVPPNAADHGPVVAVEVRDAGVRASLLDAEDGGETPLSNPSGNLIPLAPLRTAEWLGFYYNARRPPDLVRLDPETGSLESITGFRDRTRLDLEGLAPAEDFRWRSVDGLEVQGWLYRAHQSIGTVVLVHGGPTSHSEDRFNAQVQYFVYRGFDVLAPNYRGSTGFGVEFQERIKADGWGGREQEDIRTGIEALIRTGIARPGRVGVTGTSYGGYSAWWAITHYPPDLVAAAAPVCGMTDLIVDYYATRPDLRPYSEEMMGGSPEEVPEVYRDRSPINHVRNIRGQLLIVQGLKDPNVTADNVHAVVKELERHEASYELLTFEDEGHGIVRPQNLKTLYPRLADFFEEAFSRG